MTTGPITCVEPWGNVSNISNLIGSGGKNTTPSGPRKIIIDCPRHDMNAVLRCSIQGFSKKTHRSPALSVTLVGKMQEKEGISLVLRIGVFHHQNISPDRKFENAGRLAGIIWNSESQSFNTCQTSISSIQVSNSTKVLQAPNWIPITSREREKEWATKEV